MSFRQNTCCSGIISQQLVSASQFNYEYDFNTNLPVTTESNSLPDSDPRDTAFDSVIETEKLPSSILQNSFSNDITQQQSPYASQLNHENFFDADLPSITESESLPYSDLRETVFDLVTETENLPQSVCPNSSDITEQQSSCASQLTYENIVNTDLLSTTQSQSSPNSAPKETNTSYLLITPENSSDDADQSYLLCTQESSSDELSVYQPILMFSLPTHYDKKVSYCRRSLFENLENGEKLTSVTGINQFALFEGICKGVEHYVLNRIPHSRNHTRALPTLDRVLLTLMILKLSISFEAAGAIFGVSESVCSKYFEETILILHAIVSNFVRWSDRSTVQKNMPRCFRKYSNTIVVIDSTEVKTMIPKCVICNIQTYSNYKCAHTVKFTVGMSPDGKITFLSKIYGGRASDKFIFCESGLLNLCAPGDAIMADKGYPIAEECARAGVQLYQPPFKVPGQEQLSYYAAEQTRDIAQARVHVERCIQRLKIFHILKSLIPWNLYPYLSEIVTVISGIVNLSAPILSPERF